MKFSENSLKWIMNFYPPMLLQRIWVKKVHKNFRGIDIKINRSFVTTNVSNSTFGGTIFSATDPFYALLFKGIMEQKGYEVAVWLKSAQIEYIKPAYKDLFYTITISEAMIEEAESSLLSEGKFVKAFPIELFNKEDQLCAHVMNEIYIRDVNF